MVDIDYFEQFDDEASNNTKDEPEALPKWVSDKNSSLAAYRAIRALYKEKMSYIRLHRKKSHYAKKGVYQISKSEVARKAGKAKPNALFHSVDYADHLTKELADKNQALLEAKNKALENRGSSLQALTKAELKSKLKGRERYKELAELKADEALSLALERLPFDVKRRLKLI